MPLPQPLPQDAPTTCPTALQKAWKIGIVLIGSNTGAGQSNPMVGFGLMTGLLAHLYQQHELQLLPIVQLLSQVVALSYTTFALCQCMQVASQWGLRGTIVSPTCPNIILLV